MLLSRILPEVARLHPDKLALKNREQAVTYAELLAQVQSVAHGYQQLHIKPGDRVAILGNPSPNLAIAEYAAVSIGAIPVAIFPSLAPAEIRSILEDAAPAAIIYDEKHRTIVDIMASLINENIFLIPSLAHNTSTPSIQNFISQMQPLTVSYEADLDDPAIIIYTGGTTGRSKGVMHSHRSIRSWAQMNPTAGIGHAPNKKSIVFNLAHLTGQYALWQSLVDGSCLLFLDSYPVSPEEIVSLIEREQLTHLGTVGLLLRDIVNLPNIKERNLQSVRAIGCGGAPISLKTLNQTLDVFPKANIVQVYSQTESGNFISYSSINQIIREGKLNRLSSIGNPANMVQWGQQVFRVRLVDDFGNDVAQGATGEVVCQGPQTMLGYWNNPEETKKALRDGWLYTGDIGRFDEDGYLFLMDRKKDIIIVNGANVYGSEVEEVLTSHPSILEAAVIGTPLPDEGEEVTAAVTLNPGADLSLEELQQFCADHLAAYKIPTRLLVLESMPRTSVGKLNKAQLREPFWSKKSRQIN